MNDDQPNQETNEGQRGRSIISPTSRRRSTSRRDKPKVNTKRRSRSLVLFSSTRFDLLRTLSTARTPPLPTASLSGAPQTTQPPSNSEIDSERLLLKEEPWPQGPQPRANRRDDICASEQESDYRKPIGYENPLDSARRAADHPSTKPQKLKTVPRLKIMAKKLIASIRKTKRGTPSPPCIENPLSSPNNLAPNPSHHQDDDQGSFYFTPQPSEIDDDAATFYTAMTWEHEDAVEPIDDNNPFSLHPLEFPSLHTSDAHMPSTSPPSPHPGISDDAPEVNLRRRPRVDTWHSIPSMEEPHGVSPSTSGSGSMPPSPQLVAQVDSVKTEHSPIVTIDRDIWVDHLPDGNGDIDSYIPKMKSHQSLLFQTRLDRKTGEDTIYEQTIKVDKPREDIKLAPLSTGGALDCIHWEAGFRRESTYCETQGGHLGLTKEDTEQDDAVVAVACSSPSVAIHPELVPLPCDEEDLDLATAGQTCSMTQDQTITSAESRTGGQAFVSPALNADSDPEQHPLPGGPSDSPYISRDTQDALIDVFRERVALEVKHPHFTDVLPASRKHLDRMQEKHTTDPVVSESSLEADARGGFGSEPQPSDKQPLDDATPGAGAQGRTRSIVENINQVGAQSTTSATDVQGSTIDEAEVILQLLRMAAQLVPKKKANPRNDTFDEGDLDRLFQSQSTSFVLNYTNNIHNVTHASGDNFNGPMSQSSVGGHGSRNNISNQK